MDVIKIWRLIKKMFEAGCSNGVLNSNQFETGYVCLFNSPWFHMTFVKNEVGVTLVDSYFACLGFVWGSYSKCKGSVCDSQFSYQAKNDLQAYEVLSRSTAFAKFRWWMNNWNGANISQSTYNGIMLNVMVILMTSLAFERASHWTMTRYGWRWRCCEKMSWRKQM